MAQAAGPNFFVDRFSFAFSPDAGFLMKVFFLFFYEWTGTLRRFFIFTSGPVPYEDVNFLFWLQVGRWVMEVFPHVSVGTCKYCEIDHS